MRLEQTRSAGRTSRVPRSGQGGRGRRGFVPGPEEPHLVQLLLERLRREQRAAHLPGVSTRIGDTVVLIASRQQTEQQDNG